MKRSRLRPVVRPLLSVAAVTLAACGSVSAPAPSSAEPAPIVAEPARPAASAAPGAALVPRTLANGRPACGNVASRAPRPANCE